jgi:RNA polymerase sigma factor (sigma-70 family)
MEKTETSLPSAAIDVASAGTNAELLERFTRQRDESAFAALVRRHGPLVLGVCRRVLHHEQDAEDAFQATFLVLVRKATSIRKRESVGSWLYGVAYRIARKAKASKARQPVQLTKPHEIAAAKSSPEWMTHELRALLDREVNRLPDKYRVPFMLCYVEGKTNAQAAEQLGCPAATVSSRLVRARERLRSRLTRRELAFPAGLVTAVLAERAVAVEIPALLANSTVQAAVTFASAQAGAAVLGVPGLAGTPG